MLLSSLQQISQDIKNFSEKCCKILDSLVNLGLFTSHKFFAKNEFWWHFSLGKCKCSSFSRENPGEKLALIWQPRNRPGKKKKVCIKKLKFCLKFLRLIFSGICLLSAGIFGKYLPGIQMIIPFQYKTQRSSKY